MEVAGGVVAAAAPNGVQSGYMQEPLLKGNEIDKALAAGFASVSEAFAAKLRSNAEPSVFAQSKLKGLGLDATSHEFTKLRDELLTGALRLRTSTWAKVSEAIHLKDFQRTADAEQSKGVKLVNEKSKPPNKGGDFLKKTYADTQWQLAAAKEAPGKLAAQTAEFREERITLTTKRKEVLADCKATQQRRRKLVYTMNQVLAKHAHGGIKEVQRAETEAALRGIIEQLPQWSRDQFERARIAHAEEDQRLAAGWGEEKVELQEEILRTDEGRERWMMQAEEIRQLLIAATSARPPQDQPDLASLVQLVKQTKQWEQEEEEQKNHVMKLREALERHERHSESQGSNGKEDKVQSLRNDFDAAQQKLAKRHRWNGKSIPKVCSTTSDCSSNSLPTLEQLPTDAAPKESLPKESLYLDVRQALVRNGVKDYLQSKELQQLFEENRRLEQEYKEALQRKQEQEAAAQKELQDVLDGPSRLQAELDTVIKNLHGLNKTLKTLRRQVLRMAMEGKTNAMLHAAKHFGLCQILEDKEQTVGAMANGVMHANVLRADVAREWLTVLSEHEPILKKQVEFQGNVAARLSNEFDKIHATTQFEVSRLVRFKDRGAVTLLLQAADQHVMNIEQHAAERDIQAQFEGILQAARA